MGRVRVFQALSCLIRALLFHGTYPQVIHMGSASSPAARDAVRDDVDLPGFAVFHIPTTSEDATRSSESAGRFLVPWFSRTKTPGLRELLPRFWHLG